VYEILQIPRNATNSQINKACDDLKVDPEDYIYVQGRKHYNPQEIEDMRFALTNDVLRDIYDKHLNLINQDELQ
jgi:hypothetical protein